MFLATLKHTTCKYKPKSLLKGSKHATISCFYFALWSGWNEVLSSGRMLSHWWLLRNSSDFLSGTYKLESCLNRFFLVRDSSRFPFDHDCRISPFSKSCNQGEKWWLNITDKYIVILWTSVDILVVFRRLKFSFPLWQHSITFTSCNKLDIASGR